MFFNFYIGELPTHGFIILFSRKYRGIFFHGQGLDGKNEDTANAFAQALFPYTAASTEKVAVNRTNILCRNFLVITGCMVIVLAIFSSRLLLLLYGEAFLPVDTRFLCPYPCNYAMAVFPVSDCARCRVWQP